VHYPSDAVASILWVAGVYPAARIIWVRMVMPLVPFLREGPRPAPAETVTGPRRRGI